MSWPAVNKSGGVLPVTALCVFPHISGDSHDTRLWFGSGGTLFSCLISDLESITSHLLFDSHNIHGVKACNDGSVLVFGDKSVVHAGWNDSLSSGIIRHFQFRNLDDLVFDCDVVRETAGSRDISLLAIAFAHNFVDLVDMSSRARLIRVQCPSICVLFSLSLVTEMSTVHADTSATFSCRASSGTAFGHVIMWNFECNVQLTKDESTTPLTASLTALRTAVDISKAGGVIFRTVWSKDHQRIATASDDRTCRVWGSESGAELFVGWGHVSRVWDVAFVGEAEDRLISSSEDGTMRLWDLVTAQCISVLRGHLSDIWRVGIVRQSQEYIVVSGGNDGAIKCWQLSAHIHSSAAEGVPCGELHAIPTFSSGAEPYADSVSECAGPTSAVDVSSLLTPHVDEAKFDTERQEEGLVEGDGEGEGEGVEAMGGPWTEERAAFEEDGAEDVDVAEIEVDGIETSAKDTTTANKKKKKKKKKKTPNPNSNKNRRQNGVCSVALSPCGRLTVVVLVDGLVWLWDRSQASQPPDLSVALSLSAADDPTRALSGWTLLHSLGVPACSASIHFDHGVNGIATAAAAAAAATTTTTSNDGVDFKEGICTATAAIAQANGLLSVISISYAISSTTMLTVEPVRCSSPFQAHTFRVVNMWFLPRLAFAQSCDGSIQTHDPPLTLVTAAAQGECRVWSIQCGGTDTSVLCVPMWQCVTGGKHNIASIATALNVDGRYMLLIGDSRGGLTSFQVPVSSSTLTPHDSSFLELVETQFISAVHGTDPVSSLIARPSASGVELLSVGHDGYMNHYTYREVDPSNGSRRGGGGGSGSGGGSGGSGSFVLEVVSKLTCLPIKTPDHIEYLHDKVLVHGYLGSLFIVWDIRNKHEWMRVEGGGWKRPHHARTVLTSAGHLRSIFICPIPYKHTTVLSVFDSHPQIPSMVHTPSSRPLRYVSSDSVVQGLGRVAYSGTILQTSVGENMSSYVVVGGEEGVVKVVHSRTCQPTQELHMPYNLSVKALSCVHGGGRGLLVAAGGKLSYSVWSFDSVDPIPLLQTVCSGSIWPRASQDHRILCSSCLYSASPSLASSTAVSGSGNFIIVFGDSRGITTVCSLSFLSSSPSCASSSSSSSAGSHKDRERLVVQEELQVSECPVLSCSIAFSNAGTTRLLCVGDTIGTVSVWTLGPASEAPRIPLLRYCAHAMGSNALSSRLTSSLRGLHLFVVSGGDDQAITVLSAIVQEGESSVVTLQDIDVERCDGSSGSAIKGIEIVTGERDCSCLVVSVGYDQRLSVLELLCPSEQKQQQLPQLEDVSLYQPRVASVWRMVGAEPSSRFLRWRNGRSVNVGDVSSLCAGVCRSGTTTVAVMGEGVQVFDIVI